MIENTDIDPKIFRSAFVDYDYCVWNRKHFCTAPNFANRIWNNEKNFVWSRHIVCRFRTPLGSLGRSGLRFHVRFFLNFVDFVIGLGRVTPYAVPSSFVSASERRLSHCYCRCVWRFEWRGKHSSGTAKNAAPSVRFWIIIIIIIIILFGRRWRDTHKRGIIVCVWWFPVYSQPPPFS